MILLNLLLAVEKIFKIIALKALRALPVDIGIFQRLFYFRMDIQ